MIFGCSVTYILISWQFLPGDENSGGCYFASVARRWITVRTVWATNFTRTIWHCKETTSRRGPARRSRGDKGVPGGGLAIVALLLIKHRARRIAESLIGAVQKAILISGIGCNFTCRSRCAAYYFPIELIPLTWPAGLCAFRLGWIALFFGYGIPEIDQLNADTDRRKRWPLVAIIIG
jgi:hypothetical protein